jgi:hypothetical protein
LYNLTKLQAEAARRVRNNSLGASQWTIWANDVQNEIAGHLDLPSLTYTSSFSTVDGTKSYYIDEFIPGTLFSVIDTTNEVLLIEQNEKTLLNWDLNRDEEGGPTHYSVEGLTTFQAQPASATVIDVVSSSASDVTQIVRVRGLVSGVDDDDSITLTGTTTASTTKLFSEIRQLTKSDVTVGKVTISSSTTTLAIIPKVSLATEYIKLSLYPIPDSVYTISIRGCRRPLELVNAEDIPELPADYHELIVIGMQERAHQSLLDFKVAGEIRAMFEAKLERLRRYGSKSATYAPRLSGRPRSDILDVGNVPSEYQNIEH